MGEMGENEKAQAELDRFLRGFDGIPTEHLLAGTGYTASDPVNQPAHYQQFGMEVIDIIRHVLGPDGFRAYCIGNELKYRLRAGDKGDAAQDMAKAMKYREFREVKA